MANILVTVALPVRAALWIKKLAEERKRSSRLMLRDWLLRTLAEEPGVDLSRHPYYQQGRQSHGGENKGRESREGGDAARESGAA